MGDALTARLVLHPDNKGWILEKFAVRLVENLPYWNVTADIGSLPSKTVDINHWMLFTHCSGARWPNSTMLVTHIEDPTQLEALRGGLEVVDVGVCLSRMAVENLVWRGFPRQRLCCITPAHDGLVLPRRIVIGITSRLYQDGRKRESVLLKVADSLKLDAFHFEIFGQGWESVVPALEAGGATVSYWPGTQNDEQDYRAMAERVPLFDYYLYTGLDEGSMGFLDALAAGVPTIVTPQGFHLDVEGGMTHPFRDGADLARVFEEIAAPRLTRITSVRNLTWREYARQHSLVWRAILTRKADALEGLLCSGNDRSGSLGRMSTLDHLREDLRVYSKPLVNRLRRLMTLR